MSVNNLSGVIPFTELFERALTLSKTDSYNNEDYVRGLVNDCYTRDLPRERDWNPIVSESSFTTSAPYVTGTASVNAGSISVTGSGTAWTADMTAANGWKIKFAPNDIIYTFTRVSATTATISPALSGTTNLTGMPYSLFCDEYQLASDFDRFLQNGSIYAYIGGRLRIEPIPELTRTQFRLQFFPSPVDPIYRSMLTGTHPTTGCQMVRVNPPPANVVNYPYEYVKKIAPMFEYTTGTVTVTNGSTAVTGVGTVWSTNLSAGMYFRLDATGRGDSSKWYQIASVTDNTHIVLATAYADASSTGEEYTACTAPTAFPSKFHKFILMDVVMQILSGQDDPSIKNIVAARNDILAGLHKDYRGRRTNQQFGVYDDDYRR